MRFYFNEIHIHVFNFWMCAFACSGFDHVQALRWELFRKVTDDRASAGNWRGHSNGLELKLDWCWQYAVHARHPRDVIIDATSEIHGLDSAVSPLSALAGLLGHM